MFQKKIGKITSIFVLIAICVSFIIPVSANYVDMLDHGLYFVNGSYAPYILSNSNGAGNTLNTVTRLVPMWALDMYDLGKTYTFYFKCTIDTDISLKSTNYVNIGHALKNSVVDENQLEKVYKNVTYNAETKEIGAL